MAYLASLSSYRALPDLKISHGYFDRESGKVQAASSCWELLNFNLSGKGGEQEGQNEAEAADEQGVETGPSDTDADRALIQ
ncbi:uncharacterized protein LOC100766213 isoform X12 [Cricetulus griseus]|uniref:Uncharacterized protein LOC100766213 isoform X12 n=1 Tax=Cricetulus griseus TaxID=10029 RepID=A0A9J7GY27_CRIGR|nr:uncharacterized protein LOC100766213 isoform X12 [Cricetulus griseus]